MAIGQALLEHRVSLLHLIEADADEVPCLGLTLPLPGPLQNTGQDKDCPGLVLRNAQVLSWEN